MSLERIRILTERELADAFRNRWFVIYTVAFVVLCTGLALLVTGGPGYGTVAGFGKTSAGLVNLVLFLTPLMGLTLGAQALAGERERGTLLYLRAQPVSAADLFLSKYLGLAIGMAISITLGFSLSAIVASLNGGAQGIGSFLALTGLTIVLGWISLSLGYLISSGARRSVPALGLAIIVWLGGTLLGDLGLLGTALVVRLSPTTLLALTALNPLESYRIAAIFLLRGSLDLLGPAGLVVSYDLGRWAGVILAGVLGLWLLGPLPFAYHRMRREDEA